MSTGAAGGGPIASTRHNRYLGQYLQRHVVATVVLVPPRAEEGVGHLLVARNVVLLHTKKNVGKGAQNRLRVKIIPWGEGPKMGTLPSSKPRSASCNVCTACLRVGNVFGLFMSRSVGGFHSGGGTILHIPYRSASRRILLMYTYGLRNSSTVG